MKTESSNLRAVLIGTLGFTVGGIVGNLFTYLIIISGVASWLISFIPEGQTLVRLLVAILAAFLIVALGGAFTGIINGLAVKRIDKAANTSRYLVSFGYAFAIGQGIFFIPTLLLISFISLYNNAPQTQPQAYLIFFGLLGVIYGMLIGLLLSFITIRFRYTWIAFLASLLGFAAGGMLLGLGLYNSANITLGTYPLLKAISRLGILSSLVYIPAGAALGLAYHYIAQKRKNKGDEAVTPSKWQPIVVIAVSLLVYFSIAGVVRQIEKFLIIRPGSTADILIDQTIGTHWSPPVSAAAANSGSISSKLTVHINPAGVLAIGWSQETDFGSDVYFLPSPLGSDQTQNFLEPVNVSNSALQTSGFPGIAVDNTGTVHLVWEESNPDTADSQVLYSRCEGGQCSDPVLLSDLSNLDCSLEIESGGNRWPAIALDNAGNLMVAWSSEDGAIIYSTWTAGASPPVSPTGCVPSPANGSVQVQLSGASTGQFALVYAADEIEQTGVITVRLFKENKWDSTGAVIGVGSSPDIILDDQDQIHVTWCGEDQDTLYQNIPGETEQIPSPSCTARPLIAVDSDNLPHIIWYSDQVTNANGYTSAGSYIYESIRTGGGWSSPAIVSRTENPGEHDLAAQPGGDLHLVWVDSHLDQDSIYYTRQENYACSVDSLSRIGRETLAAIQGGGFHPPDYEVPFCDNRYLGFIHQPNPDPAYSDQPSTLNGGFDRVAELAATAQYEVLFTVMQWEQDENDYNPGSTLARAVAELYNKIKTNPQQYPRGLTVRILLGNYPTVSTLQWGDQIWNVLEDLRDEGVPEMVNEEIGWKVEIANFEGTYPHAHTKFMIVDGKTLMGAGFNYGWLHFSSDHPSGKGDDLVDLGMVVEGPVAQAAISAYDDMWVDGNQLQCTDFFPEDGSDWTDTCRWNKAAGGHVPEVMKYFLSEPKHNAFSLYRSGNYKEADGAYSTAFSSAQSSIDAIHVNFSMEMICFLNVVAEDLCSFDNALPWMEAMLQAVEQNQVKVRAIVENSNSNGIENRIGIDIFEKELASRGLEDLVEIRFFNGRVHAKSALVDQEFLVVGSQNLHYSSWGDRGLLEYGVATDDPEAVKQYQKMFDYYWDQAIPMDEADWTVSN